MKKKLLSVTILFILVLTTITFLLYNKISDKTIDTSNRESIVALNEIEQLSKQLEKQPDEKAAARVHEAIADLQNQLSNHSEHAYTGQARTTIIIFYILCVVFLISIFGYAYTAILRPFDKMKDYAKEIASGNLDIPLNYERSNYFGAYTWAFDHMRREIMKARSCEKEAILNNKTVIATLSHDIKTPIASIRAYTEGLEANMDTSMEKRKYYTSVIIRKCDEVTKLTNDLFLHSLSDLDKLRMDYEDVEISHFLTELYGDKKDDTQIVTLCPPIPSMTLKIDRKRLEQAIENLVNNARKYAQTPIELSVSTDQDFYAIHIRDFGPGIPDEDMPFITEKFYRGHNAENQEGSGLGLYIVSYIMKQHGGALKLYNHKDGLEAILEIPRKYNP